MVEDGPVGHYELDLSGVRGMDGGSAALLIQLIGDLRERGAEGEIVGATGKVRGLLELYGAHPPKPSDKAPPARVGLFEQVGAAVDDLLGKLGEAADYIGTLVAEARLAIRTPRTVPWGNVVRLAERHGADALPIVAAINFLVGLILAFQASGQLERFGAEILVADLVGLSVVRELGPLMTAIIVAGRSGAAFAAELGTMRVSEEVDALRTLGMSPYRFLVAPRFIALILTLPLLTLMADGVGLLGGLVVGIYVLDLTLISYWNETLSAVGGLDILGGLIKSVLFAMVIAAIACQRGLATSGGAEGVGRSTTSAVVTTIFHLVLLDAALTWVFRIYGI
ncbi:putative phospholipid ABC transporter permease protein MlaE [Planctomycetes bacterium Pla86]|uniref:Putative phospholipid ABC transporter permease protein MlaE n=2 Tax=Engelhardtia mirabilis TaxID=2528011 RepID=A0A518BLG3_9BACT|nr:putative phospholipid ABC transporter permease protein MlaE [Planctomycetes bacterium Pla133]QDV02142.1 putative phospholipid ABC transporter permease protein MlaE [Planctomycetes bacterium Pla86]